MRLTVNNLPEIVPSIADPARSSLRCSSVTMVMLRLTRSGQVASTILHGGGMGTPGELESGGTGRLCRVAAGHKAGCRIVKGVTDCCVNLIYQRGYGVR